MHIAHYLSTPQNLIIKAHASFGFGYSQQVGKQAIKELMVANNMMHRINTT